MKHNSKIQSEQELADSRGSEPRSHAELSPRSYVSPAILSHSGEDVLEELGPTQACYPFSSCGVAP